jgi:hypothetical protein
MKLCALDPLLYPLDKKIIDKESKFIDSFYRLITDSIQPPYAISVDGLWGSGKTTVMKILERRLKDSGYPVFWFNPWEYRQSNNVVLAFLQCLASEHKSLLKEMKFSGGRILRVLLDLSMGVGLKLITQNNISLKDVKESFKEIEEKELHSYEKYVNIIKTVKKEFVELIRMISRKSDNKSVFIFFDDLDRCLPDDSIQLLEAIKNLFVTKNSKCIFLCGIDTHIAKQFISSHYNGIEGMFAIEYFRKIFNLTISVPFSPNIENMLFEYIKKQYDWNAPEDEKSKALAKMVAEGGIQAQIFSLRKYLNILDNFNVAMKFNPQYEFNPKDDFVVRLLLFKEADQLLYKKLIWNAFKSPEKSLEKLIEALLIAEGVQGNQVRQNIYDFIYKSFGKGSTFSEQPLVKFLKDNPTLG